MSFDVHGDDAADDAAIDGGSDVAIDAPRILPSDLPPFGVRSASSSPSFIVVNVFEREALRRM